LKKIRDLCKQIDLLISKALFRRVVIDVIANNHSIFLRIQEDAIETLQETTEVM
jgi:histone H3/H4